MRILWLNYGAEYSVKTAPKSEKYHQPYNKIRGRILGKTTPKSDLLFVFAGARACFLNEKYFIKAWGGEKMFLLDFLLSVWYTSLNDGANRRGFRHGSQNDNPF